MIFVLEVCSFVVRLRQTLTQLHIKLKGSFTNSTNKLLGRGKPKREGESGQGAFAV